MEKENQIRNIREQFELEVKSINNMKELNDIKVNYLGKKSPLQDMMKLMGTLSIEEKKNFGREVNLLRDEINNKFEEIKEQIEQKELSDKLLNETIDITLPSKKIRRGSKHPFTRVVEQVEDLFVSMGYDVVDGPELETDMNCFQNLNIPLGHPARDSQDSFYINNEWLLRTQTSSVQARTMQANENKGPMKIICPGKTYRRDEDATHSHQFGQVEGLVIDKNISLADLKGTLEVFARKMLGDSTKVRFRPSYFPFTEPSYEVDVTCFKCGGTGCPLCKKTGWIEVFAAGIVHPNVLRMGGYNPDEYTAFAFGPGLDRMAMFRYAIPDIRYMYTNDVRFLEQFDRKDIENEIKC